MERKRKHSGLILQVALLFAIGVLLTGVLTYVTTYRRSKAMIIEQTEVRAGEIANEVINVVRESSGYGWRLRYWYNNWDKLDIEYDTPLRSHTETYEKSLLLMERHPEIQWQYITTQQIESLSAEDQKLYAEVSYAWLTARINQIKQTYHIDFLFCVVTDEPYDKQFFLFSGADPGQERGTTYLQVYPLGTTVTVSESQQEAMRSAKLNDNYLANAGDYVDYYTSFGTIDGHSVLIGLTYNLSDLLEEIHKTTIKGTSFAVLFLLILSVTCLFAISVYALRPLKKVQESIREYKMTKDSAAISQELANVHPRNEIGTLSEDVVDLTKEMDLYLEEIRTITSERERIEAELSLATRLQAAFLPHDFPPFPDRTEFELYASMDPAREVGGDFYDYFLIDDDHLCLIMADVSGKGIPAALFMMVCKILLKNSAMLGRSVSEILSTTNDNICASNTEEMFVTVWLGILEISTGHITAANAGHEYPIIKRPDGSFELLKDKHCFIIGGMSGVPYKDYELQLEPGSKLFLYTDGIPEATDRDYNMFGTDRLLKALNSAAGEDPETILAAVRKSVDEFVSGEEQFDDLTMLCFEYKG